MGAPPIDAVATPPAALAPDPPSANVAVKPVAVPRPTHKPKARKAEPKPRLFGDRVRALEGCAPRPSCAASVLRRADDVLALSVEELRDLDAALERCLARCR
ncbi:MAG: hypothetical protein A2138_13380 [Deltaproteobacteria bacterium RBG_16_71_12]|nr:MAG: hypothetical protein A2138_13380 [Deltaproteobacteria bacterium RBG_16_71_12]